MKQRLGGVVLAAVAVTGSAEAQGVAEQPVRIERTASLIQLRPDGTSVETLERQLKVQTPAGISLVGQLSFGFDATMQQFAVLDAYTEKPDGRRVLVDKNAILLRDAPAQTRVPMFDGHRVAVIVYPDVRVGDRVFARVRYEQTQPTYPGHFSRLHFTSPHVPADEALVTLEVPRAVPIYIDRDGYDERRSESAETVLYEWRASNAVAVPAEPLSVSQVDYGKRLSISTFPDFGALAGAYWARAEDKAAPTVAVRAIADEITAGANAPRDQARRLYEWVTDNIRYVSIALGDGAVVPHRADDVLTNGYGDCKDAVTLLTALLAAKGIEARTALVEASDRYRVSQVPTGQDFNHVILYLPGLGIWVDPTATFTPFGRLPVNVQGKTALLTPTGELRTTPLDTVFDNVSSRRVQLTVQNDGTISGVTTITAKGIRAEEYRVTAARLTPNTIAEYVRGETSDTRFKGDGTVVFTGLAERTDTVMLRAEYTLSGGLDVTGSGSFEIPTGFRGRGHVSTQVGLSVMTHRWPRLRGWRETLVEEYEIVLPPTMKVVELPKPVSFVNAAVSYETAVRQEGQILRFTRRLVEQYADSVVVPPERIDAEEQKFTVVATDLRALITYATGDVPSASTSRSLSDIARGLEERRAGLQVPNAGKVKQVLTASARRVTVPGGTSPVVLLRLPEYERPYTLTITSLPVGRGMTKRVFVPTAVVLDADFRQTRALTESDFAPKSPGLLVGSRLQVVMTFDQTNRAERFVLLYTRPDALNTRTTLRDESGVVGPGGVIASLGTHFERSMEGAIEVEAKAVGR